MSASSAGMLLDDHERIRFSNWCKENAKTTEGIIAQMEKMKMHPGIIQKLKIEKAGYEIVAHVLDSTETERIQG